MLSNETIRVRTLDFKDKTVNTEPVIKDKTYEGKGVNTSADRSTSTREIDGEAVIREVQKNNTTTIFQPHQLVLRRRPSFLQPVRKGAACVCRDRVISMHCVVEFHVL